MESRMNMTVGDALVELDFGENMIQMAISAGDSKDQVVKRVKEKFKLLAMQRHPDKAGQEESLQAVANIQFQELQVAKETVLNAVSDAFALPAAGASPFPPFFGEEPGQPGTSSEHGPTKAHLMSLTFTLPATEYYTMSMGKLKEFVRKSLANVIALKQSEQHEASGFTLEIGNISVEGIGTLTIEIMQELEVRDVDPLLADPNPIPNPIRDNHRDANRIRDLAKRIFEVTPQDFPQELTSPYGLPLPELLASRHGQDTHGLQYTTMADVPYDLYVRSLASQSSAGCMVEELDRARQRDFGEPHCGARFYTNGLAQMIQKRAIGTFGVVKALSKLDHDVQRQRSTMRASIHLGNGATESEATLWVEGAMDSLKDAPASNFYGSSLDPRSRTGGGRWGKQRSYEKFPRVHEGHCVNGESVRVTALRKLLSSQYGYGGLEGEVEQIVAQAILDEGRHSRQNKDTEAPGMTLVEGSLAFHFYHAPLLIWVTEPEQGDQAWEWNVDEHADLWDEEADEGEALQEEEAAGRIGHNEARAATGHTHFPGARTIPTWRGDLWGGVLFAKQYEFQDKVHRISLRQFIEVSDFRSVDKDTGDTSDPIWVEAFDYQKEDVCEKGLLRGQFAGLKFVHGPEPKLMARIDNMVLETLNFTVEVLAKPQGTRHGLGDACSAFAPMDGVDIKAEDSSVPVTLAPETLAPETLAPASVSPGDGDGDVAVRVDGDVAVRVAEVNDAENDAAVSHAVETFAAEAFAAVGLGELSLVTAAPANAVRIFLLDASDSMCNCDQDNMTKAAHLVKAFNATLEQMKERCSPEDQVLIASFTTLTEINSDRTLGKTIPYTDFWESRQENEVHVDENGRQTTKVVEKYRLLDHTHEVTHTGVYFLSKDYGQMLSGGTHVVQGIETLFNRCASANNVYFTLISDGAFKDNDLFVGEPFKNKMKHYALRKGWVFTICFVGAARERFVINGGRGLVNVHECVAYYEREYDEIVKSEHLRFEIVDQFWGPELREKMMRSQQRDMGASVRERFAALQN